MSNKLHSSKFRKVFSAEQWEKKETSYSVENCLHSKNMLHLCSVRPNLEGQPGQDR